MSRRKKKTQTGNVITPKRTNTLVDEYIEQLADLGISLESLRILGDFEFPEEDKALTEKELVKKILEDPKYIDQKETIENYIAEFVRADFITQKMHKRRGKALVKSNDENKIDGGVYLFRTPEKDKDGNPVQVSEDEFVYEVNSDKYVQMVYIDEDEFDQKVNENDKSVRYKYTINKQTGELRIAQLKTVVTTKKVNGALVEKHTDVEVQEMNPIDYKAYIEKYTMPYEFLITLCEITQNPEYVYHVAKLARETQIVLVVQDDVTIENIITEEENKSQSFENKDSSSTADATVTDETIEIIETEVTTTTMFPHLEIQSANTWSFFEEFEYTKTTTKDGPNVSGPHIQKHPIPSELPDKHEKQEIDVNNVIHTVVEKWTGGPWLVETKTTTTTTTIRTVYSPSIIKNSVEKSKQFLGLLRNSIGECERSNCYRNSLVSNHCAKDAVFDREGINVAYKIPNATRKESALDKLKSGEKMLYDLLGENLKGNSGQNAIDDAHSEYKTKMTGIVDHLKYLMSFPENEDVDYDFSIDPGPGEIPDIDEDEINVDDLIVKTDEPGALRPVASDELVGVISVAYSGKRKENAKSIVSTLIQCQDTYKVNAIFILAMADTESNIGTANTSHVKMNNWLSWNLGHSYSSPQENVETVMKSIAKGSIYFSQGKITIKDIGLTYCPNTSSHPTQGNDWVACVTDKVIKLYGLLGIDISSGGQDPGQSEGGTSNDVKSKYTANGRTYCEYKQDSGSSWENNKFAGGTMKSSGCSITSVAIILTGYGENVTPEDLRKEVGGKTTNLVALLQKHGVSCTRPGKKLSANDIKSHLQTGKPIIVNVNGEWTSSTGHYMTLLNYRNHNGEEQVYVSNPGTVNSSKNGWVALSRITGNMKTQSILITQD